MASVIDLTGSDDEDEELKLAIALSLQDQSAHQTPSLATISGPGSRSPELAPCAEKVTIRLADSSASSLDNAATGLFALDRKQMEAERLARLKRKHETMTNDKPISPPPIRRELPSSLKRTAQTIPTHAKSTSAQPTSASGKSKLPMAKPVLGYPEGRILLTSLNTSQKGSVSLASLLRPLSPDAPLKSALLSSFIIDFDWLLPHFNTRTVSFVLALHAQNGQEKKLTQQDFVDIPNVRLVFPYVGGNVNCMHSKLMLLFYEDNGQHQEHNRCRIVVPSANLVPYDWGVAGVMENVAFIIDLPLKDNNLSENIEQGTQFKESLTHLLEAMCVPDDVKRKLEKFDFCNAANYNLAHTIGGSHILSARPEQENIKSFFSAKSGEETATPLPTNSPSVLRTGLIGLSDIVRSLNLDIRPGDPSYPPKLDFITSSMGNLKDGFLRSLFLAVCGHGSETPTNTSKPTQKKRSHTAQVTAGQDWPDKQTYMNMIRAYFPSNETVCRSRGGPNSAGTICFQSKWWDGPKDGFPKELVSDCIGIRQDGILMHSKILFVRFAKPKRLHRAETSHSRDGLGPAGHSSHGIEDRPTNERSAVTKAYNGWAYIGSANFSESAWGSVVTDSKTKLPKLTCRNWESGIVVAVPSKLEHEGSDLHNLSLEEVFGDVVPVPIEYPGTSLLQSGRRPWFFAG